MVTFLVCLVVVGGAVVAILRLTLDDGTKPATVGGAAGRGARPRRFTRTASRAAAFLVPGASTSPGSGRGRQLPLPFEQPVPPTLGAVAVHWALGIPMSAAGTDEARQWDGADGTAGAPDDGADTAVRTVTPGQADLFGHGHPVPHGTDTSGLVASYTVAGPVTSTTAVTGGGDDTDDGPTASSDTGWERAGAGPLDDPTRPTLGMVALERAQPAPPDDGPSTGELAPRRRRPARRPRPSFSRRVLRRVRGALGLLVLLLALGTVLAVTLVLAMAMIIVGVRAAVGT